MKMKSSALVSEQASKNEKTQRLHMFKRVFCSFAIVLMMLTTPAMAQGSAQTIGVVDVQKILQVSSAGKNIHDQLEAKRNSYQKEISGKEDSLRKLEKSILDQKGTMSEADFNTKRKEFEREVLSTQKVVQNNKRSLEAGFARALGKLRDEVRDTIEVVAKDRGFTMVLSQENVIIAQPAFDITDAVIAALDKRISNISIDWSVPKN